MDNLYMSAKFARAAYRHEQHILISGVTRKAGRGIPPYVLQEEKTNKKEQMRVRNTVKAAVLMGDSDCPDLLAISVYDTKPVHFLTLSSPTIKWVEKTRKVFNKAQ